MATKKVLAHLDLNKNELQNAALQNLASDPGTPAEGQVYYKTGDDSVQLRKASTWNKLLDDTDINTSTSLSGASDSNVPSSTAIKTYVDEAIEGRKWGEAIRVASTANVDISTELENGDTLDGVSLATGDRVLLKDQSTGSQNGIYIVAASGAASRSSETGSEIANHAFLITEGTTNGDTQWVCTTDSITLDTTDISFSQIGSGSVPDATTSTKGKVELATTAEVQARTDTVRAVTPSGLADTPRMYIGSISSSSGATISAATHGLGANQNKMVQLFDGETPVEGAINVESDGDVVWATNQSITSGRIVIIGT